MARVLTTSSDKLVRIEATPVESLNTGNSVLFLVDADTVDNITMRAGRRGEVYRVDVSRTDLGHSTGSLRLVFSPFGDTWGVHSTVEHVAKIETLHNSLVSVGESVLIVTGDYAGSEARVTYIPVEGSSIRVSLVDRPSRSIHVTKWVSMLPAGRTAAWVSGSSVSPAVALAPEDIPELPDYWRDRLVSFAKIAKRKHGWCAEIDKLTRQILEPALPKFQVEPHALLRGFSVIDPKTEDMVAWFATEEEATKDAESRTKKLAASL